MGDEAQKAAERRRTEVAVLAKRLQRELEWIPLKAMRKERTERYRSASELADDLENYLKGAPLMAGPPTAGYRLRQFLRRHKALVGGVAAVLVVSAIGAVVSVTFALGQARARAEAEIVTKFFGWDVLHGVSAIKGRQATVADILDIASNNLEPKFEDLPIVEAILHWYLGAAYRELWDFRAALPHLARSYELGRKHLGESKGLTMNTKNYLAISYDRTGQYTEAERLFNELIEAHPSNQEESVPLKTLKSNRACVHIEQGRYEEAESLFTKGIEYCSRELPGTDHPTTLYYMNGLAVLRIKQEQYEEAERLFDKGLEARQRKLGEYHPHTLATVNDFGVLCREQQRYEEAESLLRRALEGRKHKLGASHPACFESMHELALVYAAQERYNEAEPLLLAAYNGRETKLGPDHPQTIESLNHLVTLYESWNKPEEAEKWRTKRPAKQAVEE